METLPADDSALRPPEPGAIPRTSRWILAFFIAAAAILLLRNLALDSPLMPGDEYAYFAAAQTFPDSSERLASDPHLPQIYSPVFSGYGRLLFALSTRPEFLIKVLNVLAFAVSAMVYLSLVPAVGGRERSGLFAAWLLITPITAYTAYFMPESTYGLFFAFLAWTVVRVLPARTLAGSALAGAIVGAMLLIKPHALALVAAMGLTFAAMAVAPRRMRPAPATVAMAVGICAASCYATFVALNLLLSGHLQFHPLTFVGGVYRPVLAGTSPVAWFERPRALVTLLSGHVIVLGALLSPALGIAAGQMQRCYAGRHDAPAETRDRRLYLLICFAAAVALATVGMTTVFGMFVEQSSAIEHRRLHGRYYSFFLPLFFLVYFAVLSRPAVGSGQAREDRWLRGGAIAGAAMAAMLLYLHGTRDIFPFDFPEAFVFSSWAGRPRVGLVKTLVLTLRYGAVGAAVAVYVWMAIRGRRVWLAYPILLIALFSASNAGVVAWQRASSRDHLALRADARAAKQLIPAGARNAGIVIGPEWNGRLAYFLFNFQSSPRVLVRDPAIPLRRAGLPADARWVLLIGPYQTDFADGTRWRTGTVTFVDLGGRHPGGEGQ